VIAVGFFRFVACLFGQSHTPCSCFLLQGRASLLWLSTVRLYLHSV
jgi:hypothetical protein